MQILYRTLVLKSRVKFLVVFWPSRICEAFGRATLVLYSFHNWSLVAGGLPIQVAHFTQTDHLAPMATLIDMNTSRVRHPEKAHKPDTEVLRKPKWIRVKAPTSKGYAETRKIVKDKGLVTVCEEAACPNIGECWEKSHATFMILGEICTRACSFCNVATG